MKYIQEVHARTLKDLARIASRVLGNFERPLLNAVYELDGEAFGANITDALSKKLLRDVSIAQTTRSLKTLSDLGLLTSETVPYHVNGVRQRSRKVYSLTEAGRHVLLYETETDSVAGNSLVAARLAAGSSQ